MHAPPGSDEVRVVERPRGSVAGGLAMLVGSLAAFVALAAMQAPEGMPLSIGGLGALVGLGLLFPSLTKSEVRIGRDRLDCVPALGSRAYALDFRTVVVHSFDLGVTLRDGPRSCVLRRDDVENFDEVLSALRMRIPPHAWLAPWVLRAPGRSARVASVAPPVVGYRTSAVDGRALPAWCTVERRERLRRLAFAALALGVGAATFDVPAPGPPRGSPTFIPDDRPPPTLTAPLLNMSAITLVLLGLAVFAPVVGSTKPQVEIAATRALRWLGASRKAGGPRAVRNESRRVRVASRHPTSSIGPAGYRRDELDADDRTLRTCRVFGLDTMEPEAPLLLRSVAVLPEALDSGRHHEQIAPEGVVPRPLTRPLDATRVLVLDVHADGVMLHRFSESRGHVGDTWHSTREHALSQIADEYGAHDLAFVDVRFDADEGPLAFFRHVDLA
jgi:hypothetical protein